MTPRFSILSVTLALLIGGFAAWSLVPDGNVARSLNQIIDDDPDVRLLGWRHLLRGDQMAELAEEIAVRLETASDAALLDGAKHLRHARLWGWDRQPVAIMLRETKLLASGNDADRQLAVEQMGSCPLDLDQREVMPIFWQLLNDADGMLLDEAKEAAFGWVGPHRFHSLRQLPLLEDEDTRRLVRLAVYWAQGRHGRPSLGRSWAHLDAAAAMDQLNRSVVDADGNVYAAVLLAEHSLPREDAVALARRWVVDFDNDRKRAGALLAALLGEHADLIQEALEVATDPQVRTAQRLALFALGRGAKATELEFAHRSLHLPSGQINPDTVLCLLAAGVDDGLRRLAQMPSKVSADGIRPRVLLIERFVPYWNIHSAVEGGADPVLAYYEAMRAVWMLTHRWMDFDVESRSWGERPVADDGDS